MKRFIYVVLAAFVLALVPASYACAQWKYQCEYSEGLPCPSRQYSPTCRWRP